MYHKQWVGKVFGRLTIIEELKNQFVLTSCVCGKTHRVVKNDLRTGSTKSCGCLQKENTRQRLTGNPSKNRKNKNVDESTYINWYHMLRRCYTKTCISYKNYGGKGITVCERWHNFDNFFEDMGKRPKKDMSVDRIDTFGNYSPENCKWATKLEQNRNKRKTIKVLLNGKTISLIEACSILNLNYSTIHSRVTRGRTPQQALEMSNVAN